MLRGITSTNRYIPKTRRFTTANVLRAEDVLSHLRADLKNAMKAKDSLTSTTIRSVLADIYAIQKDSPKKIFQQSDFISIIRKAEQQRLDAAMQYQHAQREDLAEKERHEAGILSNYLPSLLSPNEVKALLHNILSNLPEGTKGDLKTKGIVIKKFYKSVDKNRVRGDIVKRQLDEIYVSQS